MSSRRVPKGPGRRPMSQKRREFVELLAKGWSMRAACQELGIGRSTGHIWKNGTVVRRKDGTVNVVPPLEPLAVQHVSSRRGSCPNRNGSRSPTLPAAAAARPR